MTRYLKRDLTDYADMDDLDTEGYSGPYNRADALRAVLPDEARVYMKKTGSWQGEYAIVVDLDGFIWVEVGYYGSCSVCDSYLHHRREETERILRSAYCFENEDDVLAWATESEATVMDYGRGREALRGALDRRT